MTRTKAELAAIERDGDTCLRCGRNLQGVPASVHHRKLKGRKVPKREWDHVENLVVVCGTGTTECHGWIHANPLEAKDSGWIVNSWDHPHCQFLADLRGNVIMLNRDGSKIITPALVFPDYPTPF